MVRRSSGANEFAAGAPLEGDTENELLSSGHHEPAWEDKEPEEIFASEDPKYRALLKEVLLPEDKKG